MEPRLLFQDETRKLVATLFFAEEKFSCLRQSTEFSANKDQKLRLKRQKVCIHYNLRRGNEVNDSTR